LIWEETPQFVRNATLTAAWLLPLPLVIDPHGEFMKRIFLFILTNIAVVAVLGIVASLLGVNRFLTANGLNLSALLGFALIMGFGGAII
jgi:hypothetical protein